MRPIERGDVIVFKFPEEPERDFIKRVIGLPGDTLELKNQTIHINGMPLIEPYAHYLFPPVADRPGRQLRPAPQVRPGDDEKEGDTGSPEVQIAVLTAEIQIITEHLQTHPKDYSSRRGLLAKVSRRRQFLDYLKRDDLNRYVSIITRLNIRK